MFWRTVPDRTTLTIQHVGQKISNEAFDTFFVIFEIWKNILNYQLRLLLLEDVPGKEHRSDKNMFLMRTKEIKTNIYLDWWLLVGI